MKWFRWLHYISNSGSWNSCKLLIYVMISNAQKMLKYIKFSRVPAMSTCQSKIQTRIRQDPWVRVIQIRKSGLWWVFPWVNLWVLMGWHDSWHALSFPTPTCTPAQPVTFTCGFLQPVPIPRYLRLYMAGFLNFEVLQVPLALQNGGSRDFHIKFPAKLWIWHKVGLMQKNWSFQGFLKPI
jgi:hypothetical protein